ncbi:MAG TPA: hypothetical protein VER12_08245 [Polyangiaceae bacterium]|nr:hypothetical protein [Polyangiaceae bacterium]
MLEELHGLVPARSYREGERCYSLERRGAVLAAESSWAIMVLDGGVQRQTLTFVCLAILWGCASATDAGSSPTEGAGGGSDSQKTTRERVLTACTEFATRLCADSEDCCQRAYARYEPSACLSTLLRDLCRPGADAVAAGFAVYDENFVEPCLAAHVRANAVCVPTWRENLTIRKSLWAACKVLRGRTESGRGCTTDVTCAEPEGEKAGVCLRGACSVLEVLPEGEACPLQSGTVSTCDAGLFCTTTTSEPGVCAPATARGSACSGVLADASCGFGNYCDPVEKRCKETVNRGGPSCRQGLECVSFDCDRISETCAPAPAIVSADECFSAP